VLKRVVFVGLTLANLATFGAAVALVLGWPVHLSALVMSLAGAAVLALFTSPRLLPAESLIGWGFAVAAGGTVIALSRASADADAMRLLYGNVLAISRSEVVVLSLIAVAVLVVHVLFARRFVLLVFDPEAARAAGVRTRLWSLLLNLTIGAAAAAAVHEAGALLTFAFLLLPPMARCC